MTKSKKLVTAVVIGFATAVSLFIVAIAVINHQIEKRLQNYSFGNFQLECKTVDANVIARRILFSGIELSDSAGTNHFFSNTVEFKEISILPILFHDKIGVGNISIDSASIKINSGANLNFGNKKNEHHKNVLLNHIKVSNADLLINRTDSTSNDTVFYAQMNFEVSDFANQANGHKYGFSEGGFDRVTIELTEGVHFFNNTLYRTGFGGISFDTDDSIATIHNGYLKSNYTKYAIAKQTGVETDWFDIDFKEFKMKGIHLDLLLGQNQFVAKTAHLEQLDFKVFRDKNPPFPDKPDTKLPMDLLNGLSFGVHFDSLYFNDGRTLYAERKENSLDEAEISFDNLQATFSNVSNIDDLIAGPTTIKVDAKPNNAALLQVEFGFPNKKYPEPYSAKGTLGPMQLSAFNSMVKPSFSAELTSGRIKSLAFQFVYDIEKSTGTMDFEYEDLKVEILDRTDWSDQWLKSFAFNKLVLNSENLKGEKFKPGSISFQRETKKSIFNYWWKSLLSGFKNVLVGQ
jgi:hypothetical protein